MKTTPPPATFHLAPGVSPKNLLVAAYNKVRNVSAKVATPACARVPTAKADSSIEKAFKAVGAPQPSRIAGLYVKLAAAQAGQKQMEATARGLDEKELSATDGFKYAWQEGKGSAKANEAWAKANEARDLLCDAQQDFRELEVQGRDVQGLLKAMLAREISENPEYLEKTLQPHLAAITANSPHMTLEHMLEGRSAETIMNYVDQAKARAAVSPQAVAAKVAQVLSAPHDATSHARMREMILKNPGFDAGKIGKEFGAQLKGKSVDALNNMRQRLAETIAYDEQTQRAMTNEHDRASQGLDQRRRIDKQVVYLFNTLDTALQDAIRAPDRARVPAPAPPHPAVPSKDDSHKKLDELLEDLRKASPVGDGSGAGRITRSVRQELSHLSHSHLTSLKESLHFRAQLISDLPPVDHQGAASLQFDRLQELVRMENLQEAIDQHLELSANSHRPDPKKEPDSLAQQKVALDGRVWLRRAPAAKELLIDAGVDLNGKSKEELQRLATDIETNKKYSPLGDFLASLASYKPTSTHRLQASIDNAASNFDLNHVNRRSDLLGKLKHRSQADLDRLSSALDSYREDVKVLQDSKRGAFLKIFEDLLDEASDSKLKPPPLPANVSVLALKSPDDESLTMDLRGILKGHTPVRTPLHLNAFGLDNQPAAVRALLAPLNEFSQRFVTTQEDLRGTRFSHDMDAPVLVPIGKAAAELIRAADDLANFDDKNTATARAADFTAAVKQLRTALENGDRAIKAMPRKLRPVLPVATEQAMLAIERIKGLGLLAPTPAQSDRRTNTSKLYELTTKIQESGMQPKFQAQALLDALKP